MVEDPSRQRDNLSKVTDVEFTQVPHPFLSSREIRAALRISEQTLYDWLAEGMPSHQIKPRGRRFYDLDEVRTWVKTRCTSPAPDQAVS
jgi:predicted DNA-binding transcriptional regulator AlpA